MPCESVCNTGLQDGSASLSIAQLHRTALTVGRLKALQSAVQMDNAPYKFRNH